MSIVEVELGDNVADMIVCSTDENLLRTPSLNDTPTCSKILQRFIEALQRFNEALKRFIIYPLSYDALQRFIEPLSN